MLEDPNYREKGKCWSNFLRHCIEHNTISFYDSSNEEQKLHLEQIKSLLRGHLGKTIEVNGSIFLSVSKVHSIGLLFYWGGGYTVEGKPKEVMYEGTKYAPIDDSGRSLDLIVVYNFLLAILLWKH